MPKRTWRVKSWRVESWRVESGAPRHAFETKDQVHRDERLRGDVGVKPAPASISGSGEAVACASAMGTVAPTAVCATQTATQFMSHSRHTLVAETVPHYPSRGALICVAATDSLQIVAGEAHR